jgi:hypothetical protein
MSQNTNEIWDELEIGSVPTKEIPTDKNNSKYKFKSKIEAKIFKEQLERHFGKRNGIEFYLRKIKQSHGTYYNVIMLYLVTDEECQRFAFLEVEDKIPEYWDAIAKEKLTSIAD